MNIKFKTLSEALYADSDYLTKLANQPKMREYCQEIINSTIDINRAAFTLERYEKAKKEIADLKNSHMINFVSGLGAIDTVLEILDKYREVSE